MKTTRICKCYIAYLVFKLQYIVGGKTANSRPFIFSSKPNDIRQADV